MREQVELLEHHAGLAAHLLDVADVASELDPVYDNPPPVVFLQSVPRGQYEAARALGLSPPRQTFLIVLPQALRNVIPAQIGQLISLFKDTALAGVAMSLFELLRVSQAITQQEQFRGQGLIGETLAFAALMFWVVSYTMSRESQRLERRLGVGVR